MLLHIVYRGVPRHDRQHTDDRPGGNRRVYVGVMPQGHATVDFGAFPGKAEARASVTGQTTIATTSDVEAWVRGEASVDHAADEHLIEDFDITAQDIVAATGFTVTMRPRVGRCYGVYNFSWVWN